jgi:hypothetical protein
MRYKVSTWHGEDTSLFYVVDTVAPCGEQPAIVATFHTLNAARAYVARLTAATSSK